MWYIKLLLRKLVVNHEVIGSEIILLDKIYIYVDKQSKCEGSLSKSPNSMKLYIIK